MKLKIVSSTCLLALALCWSCSSNNIEDDLKPAPIDICNPNDTTTVSFQDTIFPIFTKYCSNNANGDCHWTGAPISKPDYTTYAGIKAKVDQGRIQVRLFDQGTMPPSNSNGPRTVSDCDKTLILRWIAQGAPNN